MIAADAVLSVLDALQQHPSSALVGEHACRLFRNLALDEGMRTLITLHGAMDAIVAAMQRHPHASGVQDHGSGALGNLSGPQRTPLLVAAGAIEVVLAALRNHPAEILVHDAGICTLANLMAKDAIAMRAINAGVCIRRGRVFGVRLSSGYSVFLGHVRKGGLC